jgi:hypothetical protein
LTKRTAHFDEIVGTDPAEHRLGPQNWGKALEELQALPWQDRVTCEVAPVWQTPMGLRSMRLGEAV